MDKELKKRTVVVVDDKTIHIRWLHCDEQRAVDRAMSMAKDNPNWSLWEGHLTMDAKFD